MQVLIYNQQKDLLIGAISVKSLVKEVLRFEEICTDEVSVHFVSVSEICRLHYDFFADPSVTDCISFPMDKASSKQAGRHILGEVFVCPSVAIDYLKARCEESDAYTETTLYLVHGLLHLAGYDDIKEKDRTHMRAAEKSHMQNLISKSLILKKARN